MTKRRSTKMVPVTYRTKERFNKADFRHHATLLADKMESLPPEIHRQDSWVTVNECGTKACALGIAVLSHLLPGLQHEEVKGRGNGRAFDYLPLVDGETMDWDEAGELFFGNDVTGNIFSSPWGSRDEVIAHLRFYAEKGRTP